MTSQAYVHFAPQRLAPGSVIQPGNWGRVLHRYENATVTQQLFGNAWILARELKFENVRLQSFAEKPSRFAAAFCCVNENDARVYQAKVDFPRIQLLHRVELVEPALACHSGAIDMLDYPPPNTSFLDQTNARAIAYWSGSSAGAMEFVTASPLRVVANID
jgi:hypothetical protein